MTEYKWGILLTIYNTKEDIDLAIEHAKKLNIKVSSALPFKSGWSMGGDDRMADFLNDNNIKWKVY